MEDHAVVDAGGDRVRAREVDRRLVDVVAVHASVRVRAGDRDAGPAAAARHVGHARPGLGEPLVHVGDRRQPLLPEEVLEQRPVEDGLRLAAVGPVRLPGDAAAVAVCGVEVGQQAADGGDEARHRRGVGERGVIEQRLGVTGRERVAPFVGVGARVVDLEDPSDGLVLEPLADVARRGRGGDRQLGRRRRSGGERRVPAQPVARVDGEEIERGHGRAAEPLGKHGCGHGSSSVDCAHPRALP